MGPFATATEAFEHLSQPFPEDPSRMQTLLQEASDLIRLMKGQTLSAVADDTVVLPITNSDLIFLPEHPVTSITSVTENAVLLDETTYQIFQGVALWHITGTAWKYGATVVYTHGYVESDPEFNVLRNVTIESACRAYAGGNERAQIAGPTIESSGWPAEIYFTAQELERISNLGPIAVG
jgi:hypothetical protein